MTKMPPRKKTARKRIPSPRSWQADLSVKPGTKWQITLEAGREKQGRVPVKVRVEKTEPLRPARKKKPGALEKRLRPAFETVKTFVKNRDLATWLFVGAVVVYIATRLIGLAKFPIYFFTDEALQTQFVADLVSQRYRDSHAGLFPPAFRNGDYFTLGMGVYLQWLGFMLFGKSAVVTRATSALVTVIAAISVGLILRDALKVKYWWTGTLFLSITPAWFLHSRTAWETAEFVGFYAGALCAYLYYRNRSPRYLYLALFLGAMGFYTYSPGQVLVPVTALTLLVSDWGYHWKNRDTVVKALVLLAILSIQYIRFRLIDPDNAVAHLHTLGSYVFADTPLSQKILHYFSEYFLGLGAWYWYTPNNRDLERHLMKGYGHIMMATLPLALLGLVHILRRVRESTPRTILLALLMSPVATAFVATGITRAMVFVVPAAILTAIGLEQVLLWLENPGGRLAELSRQAGWSRQRILAAALVLIAGGSAAYFAGHMPDRIAVSILACLLALSISGAPAWYARRVKRTHIAAKIRRWSLRYVFLALTVFAVLTGTNVYVLVDAIRNGPTWYRIYDLGGMQYGAFQIFDIINQYQSDHPATRIVLTPTWANGTDVIARFFMNDPLPFEMGSILGYLAQKLPLDDNTVFIMIQNEYDLAKSSTKFSDLAVERIVPYPDGSPGFYFVRLRYADIAEEIFAAEKAYRAQLQEGVIQIDGEQVKVRHTYLEADDQTLGIQLIFDNDPYTLAKTYEANPFVIELTFPSTRTLNGFSIIIGSAYVRVTVQCYPALDAQAETYIFEGQGHIEEPELSFAFPRPVSVQFMRLEILDVYAGSPTKDHIWELTLR
ncbi:MAG: hypothetical protein FJZ87_02220 [Chloroflexi bacterium]|nr:hypothetical protein [Chloroflexota bacterium]